MRTIRTYPHLEQIDGDLDNLVPHLPLCAVVQDLYRVQIRPRVGYIVEIIRVPPGNMSCVIHKVGNRSALKDLDHDL